MVDPSVMDTPISAEAAEQLVNAFPSAKKSGGEGDGSADLISFHADRLERWQIVKLAELTEKYDLDIEVKRSGTGVTVNIV